MVTPLRRIDQQPLVFMSAQEIIKEYIVSNQLRPGDPLPPETELVRQLGIGRSSVREAVRALAALGLIEVRRGSGLFVGQFSVEKVLESLSYGVALELDELEDMLTVRRALEIGMIETGMAAMTDDRMAQLRDILVQMHERAVRGEAFPQEDREFHQVLWRNLNNRVLLKLLDMFWLAFNKAASHIDLQNPTPMSTYHDHEAIVDTIETRDTARARAAFDQHYAGVAERLAEARQRQQAPSVDRGEPSPSSPV